MKIPRSFETPENTRSSRRIKSSATPPWERQILKYQGVGVASNSTNFILCLIKISYLVQMMTHTITQHRITEGTAITYVCVSCKEQLARCRFTVRSFIGTRARARMHALPRALFLLLTVNRPVVIIGTTSLTVSNSTFCLCLCILCGSENKQRLFLYTASTDRFFLGKI